MNIVAITEQIPATDRKGNQLVAYYRLSHLAQLHNKIELICFEGQNKNDDIKAKNKLERKGINVHLVKKNFLESLINLLKSIFSSKIPAQCAYSKSDKFAKKIKELINCLDIDMVYCVMIRVASNIEWYKGKLVVELIDSLGLNFHYRYLQSKGLKRFFLYQEYKKVCRYEKNLANRSTCSFILSNIDKKKISSNNINVISNGVQLLNKKIIKKKKLKIVFSGNMFDQPNVDAVIWFIENCWTNILKKEPQSKFLIVGHNPQSKIISLEKKYSSIEVTGSVKSIYNILKTATVAVAPMQSGSGMQNKILEAMACSIPVVTTTKGLGDIKAINNRDLLVADKPEEFTDMVVSLLKSKLKNDYISSNGREYVAKFHNWYKINNRFFKIITKNKQSI